LTTDCTQNEDEAWKVGRVVISVKTPPWRPRTEHRRQQLRRELYTLEGLVRHSRRPLSPSKNSQQPNRPRHRRQPLHTSSASTRAPNPSAMQGRTHGPTHLACVCRSICNNNQHPSNNQYSPSPSHPVVKSRYPIHRIHDVDITQTKHTPIP
jgi:hypothetical protein